MVKKVFLSLALCLSAGTAMADEELRATTGHFHPVSVQQDNCLETKSMATHFRRLDYRNVADLRQFSNAFGNVKSSEQETQEMERGLSELAVLNANFALRKQMYPTPFDSWIISSPENSQHYAVFFMNEADNLGDVYVRFSTKAPLNSFAEVAPVIQECLLQPVAKYRGTLVYRFPENRSPEEPLHQGGATLKPSMQRITPPMVKFRSLYGFLQLPSETSPNSKEEEFYASQHALFALLGFDPAPGSDPRATHERLIFNYVEKSEKN